MAGLVLSTLSMSSVPLAHSIWLLAAVSVAFGAGLAALTTVIPVRRAAHPMRNAGIGGLQRFASCGDQ
jgi:hypothetical protein